MGGADAAWWFCSLLNVVLSMALAIHLQRRASRKKEAEAYARRMARSLYSWLSLAVALFCAVLFPGVLALFHVFAGHGEILIAAPLFNLLLAGPLIVIGRIIIGWAPVKPVVR